MVNVTVEKEREDASPRIMINSVETLDKAIADISHGLIININNIAAVKPIHEILRHDQNGPNKVYIKPENDVWDVRIELAGGFAFADNNLLSKIKAVPGVATVKEI